MELSASVMSLSSVLGIKLDFGKFSEATGVVVTLGVCACGALCGACGWCTCGCGVSVVWCGWCACITAEK